MASSSRHFFAAVLLAGLLGALILVVAYAAGCLAYVARVPYVVGRVSLAVRNSTIILLSLVLAYRLCRRLHRHLRSGWLWILALPLACLSATVILVLYTFPVYAFARPSTAYLGDLVDRLRSQRGQRLHIPFEVSGVTIENPRGWVRIILNDRLAQPLFGINLPHLYFFHEGGEVGIELAGDATVKEVWLTEE